MLYLHYPHPCVYSGTRSQSVSVCKGQMGTGEKEKEAFP